MQIGSRSIGPKFGSISAPENIGPNDVKFDPVLDQKVTCKLKANQMIAKNVL
jgi:hypothetical protein